ncbi:MAG: glycine cleavage system protein R [Gammaproteobacteria bacterium]|nr:glycine cleavage system protein R [Gammaproteobacteria bacterium]MCY4358398.1 glycine cleavage system protein R [Gammaproteobacteria bacterium]
MSKAIYTYLVLTLIADDKPGLVEALSKVIAEHQGNWLESSMSQLAGILRVSVSHEKAPALASALQELSDGWKLVVEQVEFIESQQQARTVNLSLVGNDRPGIVQEISHALAVLSINMEQLTTECSPAPMSGETLFRTKALLKVPQEIELESLQSVLEGLADDLIVEFGQSPN